MAGLRYYPDTKPGYTRKKARVRGGFHFFDLDGKQITDKAEIQRILSLAIPPAYTDVWICPSPKRAHPGHGPRRQGAQTVPLPPRWRETADANKYGRVMAFAAALPGIRKRVDADLAKPGLPREKVLATVVKLLETTLIRVGNEEYAKTNKHYGLTTMRNRHVTVKGGDHRVFLPRQERHRPHHRTAKSPAGEGRATLPGDCPGTISSNISTRTSERHGIDSADVNAYLQEISGEPFTAKDFRTWAGTVLAAMALREFESFDSEAAAKKNIVAAIEHVAERSGQHAERVPQVLRAPGDPGDHTSTGRCSIRCRAKRRKN